MHVNTLKGLFHATFDTKVIDALARETGAFERFRTLTPKPFVLSLLTSLCVGPRRSISSAHRVFERITGTTIARSSFDEKVASPEVAGFLWQLFAKQLLTHNRQGRRTWPPALQSFYDILIEDGMQMRVRNALHQRLCATTPGQAALKLLPRLSLAKGQLENLRFAAAVHHDHRLLRGTLTKGALYLRDLGFYEHDEFARIHDAGAFFVSLLKENARPVIAKAFEGIRSSFSPFEQPLDGRFSYGPTVDVDAFFRLSERSERVFRVVQIEVPSEDRHGRPTATLRRVWFVTNLDRATWTPAAIGALYRLHYTCIERLFRSCKSLGRLAHLDSGRMPVLMTFIVSSWILQTLAARLTQQLVHRYQLGNVSGDRVM